MFAAQFFPDVLEVPHVRKVPRYTVTPMSGPVPLSRIFLLIVVVEALTIAALYWAGRHFAA